jgi:hypothetical protein
MKPNEVYHLIIFCTEPKVIKYTMRRFPQSSIDAFGRRASTRKWFEEAAPNATVDDLASSFTSAIIFLLTN